MLTKKFREKSKSIILGNALTFLNRRGREISVLTFLLLFFCSLKAQPGSYSYTLSPQPVNGQYAAGTVVTFCFTLNSFGSCGTAETLEGFDFNLGSGWASINPATSPTDCAGPDSPGQGWLWKVTNTTPVGTVGPGYFYEGASGPIDGNPSNDLGDNGNCVRSFCVNLIVAGNVSAGNLALSVSAGSQGYWGSWGGNGCDYANPVIILPSSTSISASSQCTVTAANSSTSVNNCAGTTITLSASTVTGAQSYNWVGPNGYAATGQTLTIPSAQVTNAGTYIVHVAGSSSCSASTAVVVNPVPQLNPSSNSPVCECSPLELHSGLNSMAGLLIACTGPGVALLNANPTIVCPVATNSGTFTFTALQAGCQSQTTFQVVVNPKPVLNISDTLLNFCFGQLFPGQALNAQNSSITWFNSNTNIGIPASGSGNIPSTTFSGISSFPTTSDITINSNNGLCQGDPVNLTIAVNHCPISDFDQDGFSELQGDCDDLNISLNPGEFEILGNTIDENCDGSLIIGCTAIINSQPQNSFALEGNSANFSIVLPSSYSGVSYQWQSLLNGQWLNLSNSFQYGGIATSSLSVNFVNATNYGQLFRCLLSSGVNDFCPTISDSVTIYGCDSFQQNFEITASRDTVCFGSDIFLNIANYNVNCGSTSENNITCESAQPFCTETGSSYPADVGIADTFINTMYDCLLTSPNPRWFCLNVEHSGAVNITLTNSNLVDVDFILLGPFSEQNAMCAEIYNQTALIQDCSYLTDATEYIDIPNAIAGQVYILLVTNFSDMPTDITLFQSGGNGSTTCNNSFENISWQGSTLNWDDGNGTANFSPTQYGPNEYSVLATLSNGCVLSDTISIEAVGPIISLVPEISTCSLPVALNPTLQGGADYVTWTSFNNPTALSQYNTLSTTILQQPSTNTYELDVTSYSNGLYCRDSAFVVVNFIDASILLQPVSVEANLGDVVYFSCIASPGATYQWQILANGVWTNLFNAGQFSGVNTSQLSVSNVNLNNVNQQFQCVISTADGGCSETSNIVSINFCDIASSSIPSVINVSLNSSPNIGITPVTNGATYQWQSNIGFGWMNISDGVNYQGTTTPNLQIINADWQNENEWLQCVVTTNLCSDTTNICVVHITPMGIDETEAGSIYYYENAIHFSKISAALGQSYYVFDGSGKLISEGIYFGNNRIELDLRAAGVYCFKLGDEILKFIKIN